MGKSSESNKTASKQTPNSMEGDSRNLSLFIAQNKWPEYQDKKSKETWMAEVAIILTFIGSSIFGFLIWTCRRALFKLSSPESSKIPRQFSPRTSFRKNETE